MCQNLSSRKFDRTAGIHELPKSRNFLKIPHTENSNTVKRTCMVKWKGTCIYPNLGESRETMAGRRGKGTRYARARRINSRDVQEISGDRGAKGRQDPFEIFRRLIHSKAVRNKAHETKRLQRRVQFWQDDSVAGVFYVHVYRRATKRPRSCWLVRVKREICRCNYGEGKYGDALRLRGQINPSLLTFWRSSSLCVSDTSVRVQRGTISQYERGATQKSRPGRDLVDGTGKRM